MEAIQGIKNQLPIVGHALDNGVRFFDNPIETILTKEWLTTEEAAHYLGLTPGALRNMTSNGDIPYYKLGRRNRYRVEDLRKLLFNQRKGVSNGF